MTATTGIEMKVSRVKINIPHSPGAEPPIFGEPILTVDGTEIHGIQSVRFGASAEGLTEIEVKFWGELYGSLDVVEPNQFFALRNVSAWPLGIPSEKTVREMANKIVDYYDNQCTMFDAADCADRMPIETYQAALRLRIVLGPHRQCEDCLGFGKLTVASVVNAAADITKTCPACLGVGVLEKVCTNQPTLNPDGSVDCSECGFQMPKPADG